jgi:hypothetical protein
VQNTQDRIWKRNEIESFVGGLIVGIKSTSSWSVEYAASVAAFPDRSSWSVEYADRENCRKVVHIVDSYFADREYFDFARKTVNMCFIRPLSPNSILEMSDFIKGVMVGIESVFIFANSYFCKKKVSLVVSDFFKESDKLDSAMKWVNFFYGK